jgi:DNA-binding NarL/FixJ family response regulator
VAVRSTIRILIVDDQSLFRQAMSRVLDKEPDLEVVGEARDGLEAIAKAQALKPNVVVMRADLPRCDGIRATAIIRDRVRRCHVLVLGGKDDPELLLDAIEAGASGFVAKSQPLVDLVGAMRVVFGGGTLLPSSLLGPLITDLKRRIHEHDLAMRRLSRLSQREREVLGLLTEGADKESIAARLVISPETARTHVQNVLGKLGVHSRLEAAAFVAQSGIREDCWIDPPVLSADGNGGRLQALPRSRDPVPLPGAPAATTSRRGSS